MESRHLSLVGFGLGLVGSLVTVFSDLLSGFDTIGLFALGTTFVFVLGFRDALLKEAVDRQHSVTYRIANWGSGLIVVALGLLMFAVGIVSLGAYRLV